MDMGKTLFRGGSCVIFALPLPRSASRGTALPLLCEGLLRHVLRRHAFAWLGRASPCLCADTPFYALPLRGQAARDLAFALLSVVRQSLAFAVRRAAR